jgi:hypothetical protein
MPGTEGLPHALRRSAPQAGPRTVVGLFPQYLQLLPNCARRSERPEVPQPDSCTAANTRLRAMLERLKDTTGFNGVAGVRFEDGPNDYHLTSSALRRDACLVLIFYPPLQVLKVGKIAGIPREVLRPDIYPLTSAHVSI